MEETVMSIGVTLLKTNSPLTNKDISEALDVVEVYLRQFWTATQPLPNLYLRRRMARLTPGSFGTIVA